MNPPYYNLEQGVLVDDAVQFTLTELCRAVQVDSQQLIAFVDEGLLTPLHAADGSPLYAARAEWRFAGGDLGRARAAMRLMRDLELTVAGAALVIDLLEQIETLRSRLSRLGSH